MMTDSFGIGERVIVLHDETGDPQRGTICYVAPYTPDYGVQYEGEEAPETVKHWYHAREIERDTQVSLLPTGDAA